MPVARNQSGASQLIWPSVPSSLSGMPETTDQRPGMASGGLLLSFTGTLGVWNQVGASPLTPARAPCGAQAIFMGYYYIVQLVFFNVFVSFIIDIYQTVPEAEAARVENDHNFKRLLELHRQTRDATVVVTETAEAERPCSRSESGAGQCGWRARLSGCGKEKVIERSIPYGEMSAEPPRVKAVTITTG